VRLSRTDATLVELVDDVESTLLEVVLKVSVEVGLVMLELVEVVLDVSVEVGLVMLELAEAVLDVSVEV